jgi:S-ribosylhomocysteine lyase
MNAKKVSSFNVNHDKLRRGLYVSRRDDVNGNALTTFDVRMKLPNIEPVLGNPEIHTLEHLFAVYLRGESGDWADKVVYIGPMGCRTGMYLILKGELNPEGILPLIKGMFEAVMNYEGGVPATTSAECGNCLEHNLATAKWEAKKYYDEVLADIKQENMEYPTP